MSYIYPQMLEDHKKYQKKNDIKALRSFGVKIGDLFKKENLTETEKQAIYMFNRYQPTLKNDCIMNEICRCVEETDFDLKFFKNNKDEFDYKMLLDKDYVIRPRSMLYERVDGLLKQYKTKVQDMNFSTNLLMSTNVNQKEIDEFVNEVSFVNYIYFLERDIERIGIQTSEVYNYFVDIIYNKYKQGHSILWDIFSEDLLANLNKGTIIIPVENAEGDIKYFNKRYSLVEVPLEDDNI